MRISVKKIEDVLQDHGYSINNIIGDVMKTYKLDDGEQADRYVVN